MVPGPASLCHMATYGNQEALVGWLTWLLCQRQKERVWMKYEVVGPFNVYCCLSALKWASTPSSKASQFLTPTALHTHPKLIQNQRLETLQTAKDVCGKTCWQTQGARVLACLTASHRRTPALDLRTPQPGPGIVNSSWHHGQTDI